MNYNPIKCEICGKMFTPNRANAKYCGDLCREQARQLKRKQWESDTNYNERQRLIMRERDKQRAQESRQARRELSAKERERREAERQKSFKKRREALIKKADQGDTFSALILEQQTNGNKTIKYWELFKKYELEQAERLGKPCLTKINEIPITHKDFALAVVLSIEETHYIIKT